jgi:hypothetical protein
LEDFGNDYERGIGMKYIRAISRAPLVAQDDGDVSEVTQAVLKVVKTVFTMGLVTAGVKRLEQALRDTMNPPQA